MLLKVFYNCSYLGLYWGLFFVFYVCFCGGVFWGYVEVTWLFWVYFGAILRVFGVYSGFILRVFLGLFGDYFGGYFWKRFEAISGSC